MRLRSIGGPCGYTELVAAIVRSGLGSEGPKYLQTKGGQFWCWMGGIEPELVWELAVNRGPRRAIPWHGASWETKEEGHDDHGTGANSNGEIYK